jgi:hypothetical protein
MRAEKDPQWHRSVPQSVESCGRWLAILQDDRDRYTRSRDELLAAFHGVGLVVVTEDDPFVEAREELTNTYRKLQRVDRVSENLVRLRAFMRRGAERRVA